MENDLAETLNITGIGAVSAAGFGVAALQERVLAGGTLLAEFPPWAPPEGGQAVDPGWLGRVPGAAEAAMGARADGVPQALCVAWGTAAVREALADARVIGRVAGRRIALCMGTNLEDRPASLTELADRIAAACGIAGPRVVVSVACASATAGFAVARELFACGDVDAVVVGGCDVLTPRVIAGFRLLKLIAAGPCGPFGGQLGTSLGEGAGFVVLEREVTVGGERAGVRGEDDERGEGGERAGVRGEALLGEGLAADGYHATSPEPQGRGTAAVVAAVLRSAGLEVEAVAAINAHATGTLANDEAEVRGLRRALGERADAVPVSASKSVLGHAQGAAGGLELIVALLARRAGVVPPTVNFVAPARGQAPRDPVAGERPRRHAHDVVLSLSAGFGGANAAIVVGSRRATQAVTERTVRIGRVASVTAAGLRAGALTRAEITAAIGRRVAGIDWRTAVRGVDLRRKHVGACCMTAAVAHALGAGGRGGADAGLVVGQRRVSPTAIARIGAEIAAHGLLGASATAFAESLMVNAAGDCAAACELLGPFNVLAGGEAAGLLALIHASGLLQRDPTVRRMVAAAVEEVDPAAPEESPLEGAAAVCVGDEGAWVLRGAGIAGPAGATEALALAVAHARIEPAEVVAAPVGGAIGGLLALQIGMAEEARPFAVVVEDLRVGCCAVVVAPG